LDTSREYNVFVACAISLTFGSLNIFVGGLGVTYLN